jgi:dipeptidyl aminopeptidase/acylaminoacyl peptidase
MSDIEDAIGAAQYLCSTGKADPTKLVLCGGSAGGYTVLRALTVRPGFFRAGLSLYGISNLFTLAADTHKFEARYLDSLLGPLPEAAAIYRERSPIFSADKLRDPVAIFQGAEDRVVPPSQAEEIVANLQRRNVPHVYHLYKGEGHGWRRPETIAQFYKDLDAFLKEHVLFA